jgi:long-subunit acyl-CoA synthetase (AMP-forming)
LQPRAEDSRSASLTGGGLPQGVELTHYNLVSNLCQVAAPSFIHLSPDDTLIAVLPFFHSYGKTRSHRRVVLVARIL